MFPTYNSQPSLYNHQPNYAGALYPAKPTQYIAKVERSSSPIREQGTQSTVVRPAPAGIHPRITRQAPSGNGKQSRSGVVDFLRLKEANSSRPFSQGGFIHNSRGPEIAALRARSQSPTRRGAESGALPSAMVPRYNTRDPTNTDRDLGLSHHSQRGRDPRGHGTGHNITVQRGYVVSPANSCSGCDKIQSSDPFKHLQSSPQAIFIICQRKHQEHPQHYHKHFANSLAPVQRQTVVEFKDLSQTSGHNMTGVSMCEILDGTAAIKHGTHTMWSQHPFVQMEIHVNGFAPKRIEIPTRCADRENHAHMTISGLAYYICYHVERILKVPEKFSSRYTLPLNAPQTSKISAKATLKGAASSDDINQHRLVSLYTTQHSGVWKAEIGVVNARSEWGRY
ncbi:hypothetical protein C8J56DRAFT_897416 [Mycena floridula]|nr:hypothetical protein C8J56DRAFT_897416 [Mycena floridula]